MSVQGAGGQTLTAFLDALAAGMLLDLADSPEDEQVPIGRLLIELFEADERGYEFPDDLRDLCVSVGELRNRLCVMREQRLG